MLWGRKPLEFSVADTKAIVQEALPELEKKLGQPIYLTSTGVITHDQLANDVRDLLTKGREETSLDLMSFDLDVARNSLQAVLDESKIDKVYFGSTILPQPVVQANLDKLENVQEPVLAIEYCKTHNISMKLLEWLCKQADFVIVEGLLLKELSFTTAKKEFVQNLSEQKEPTNLKDIVPNKLVLPVLLSVYSNSSEIPGSIDRNTLLYTPRSYIESQRSRALDKLRSDGKISNEELKNLTVRDPAKFARKNSMIDIEGYVVTPEYVASQTDHVKQLLDDPGYVVIDEDIELGQKIVEKLSVQPRFSNGFNRFFVNPAFETKLKDQVTEEATKQAEDEAEKVTITPGEGIKELVAKVSGKALSIRDVEQRLGDIPEKLQKQIAVRISPSIRQSYLDQASQVLQAKLDEIQKQVTLKLGVYLSGLLTLEEPLKAVAFKEWEQYLSDCDCLPVSGVDDAKSNYVENVSVEELQSTAAQIVSTQERKLQAASDPALVLHLAVVVWHARHHVPSQTGVLRIRGKLVPKVLKAFEFPSSFNLLKKAVVSGEGAKELAKEVKQQVSQS